MGNALKQPLGVAGALYVLDRMIGEWQRKINYDIDTLGIEPNDWHVQRDQGYLDGLLFARELINKDIVPTLEVV